MALNFNTNSITTATWNGNSLTQINWNGVKVWPVAPAEPLTEFYIMPSVEAYVGLSIGGSWSDPEISKDFYYSFDRNSWTAVNSQTLYNNGNPANFIHVSAGQKIYFWGVDVTSFASNEWACYVWSVLDSTKTNEVEYDIGGLLDSLYNYQLEALGRYADRYSNCRLFWSTFVKDASKCILPYSAFVGERLFEGCTHLVYAPQFQKGVADDFLPCLDETFAGCTSLITIPKISGTYEMSGFDWGLFFNCSSLKFSATQTVECPNAYTIPATGTWADVNKTFSSGAFGGTSGTYDGDLVYGTTYYTNATVVPEYTGSTFPDETLNEFYIMPYKNAKVGFGLVRDLPSVTDKPLQYSFDRVTWYNTSVQTLYGTGDQSTFIPVNGAQKIYFKADNTLPYGANEWRTFRWSVVDSSGNETEFNIGGNYNSLYNYNMPSSRYINVRAFWSTKVVHAIECVMPYKQYVFENLFQNCSVLTTPPRLERPQTITFLPCLNSLFNGCTKLSALPELSGPVQANSFINEQTFYNCSRLGFSQTQYAGYEQPAGARLVPYKIPASGEWTGTQEKIQNGMSGTIGPDTTHFYYGTQYYVNVKVIPMVSLS